MRATELRSKRDQHALNLRKRASEAILPQLSETGLKSISSIRWRSSHARIAHEFADRAGGLFCGAHHYGEGALGSFRTYFPHLALIF
jgi:hypothetical protein